MHKKRTQHGMSISQLALIAGLLDKVSLDQLMHKINIAHEYSCESNSIGFEEQTLNLKIESSQPIEESKKEEYMQNNVKRMKKGIESGTPSKEKIVEASNNTCETKKNENKNSGTIKIRSINETMKDIEKKGNAHKEAAAVTVKNKFLKIESLRKEWSNKRGRGKPSKKRITENMVDKEEGKESITSNKSARKQGRPAKVMGIMDNKPSLKGVGQGNTNFSVANERLCINQIDDDKSNEKKPAIEKEIPESLKFVLNSGCTRVPIENETHTKEKENRKDFFAQSGSLNDVCHLNVEDQVVKMSDSASMKLPFLKLSPLWEAIESSEVFTSMPQQPHFLPLKQYIESRREGMAIGLMVSFSTIVNNIFKFCISDPDESIEEMLDTLNDFERHGFNLYNLRDRLECFRILKEDYKRVMNEIHATNELKSNAQNKEDLLNVKLEAIHKSITEIGRIENFLKDEKSSTLEQVEGFTCGIIRLQNDKKAIEKSFLAAKSSLDCARGSMGYDLLVLWLLYSVLHDNLSS